MSEEERRAKMTPEQRKLWDETKEIEQLAKEEVLENKKDFDEGIRCAICEVLIGYSKDNDQMICVECGETG